MEFVAPLTGVQDKLSGDDSHWYFITDPDTFNDIREVKEGQLPLVTEALAISPCTFPVSMPFTTRLVVLLTSERIHKLLLALRLPLTIFALSYTDINELSNDAPELKVML